MYITMLGKPASGKGTVGKLLAEALNIAHISSGDLFRDYVKEAGELGEKINSYISKGNLVPDELAMQLIEKRLEEYDCKNGAILDGFPRTETQAVELNKYLVKFNGKIDMALELQSDDEEIVQRTINRRTCSNKKCGEIYNLLFKKPKQEGICDRCGSTLAIREDDNEETIRKRLDKYYRITEKLLTFYEKEKILYSIEINLYKGKDSETVKAEVMEYISQNIK